MSIKERFFSFREVIQKTAKLECANLALIGFISGAWTVASQLDDDLAMEELRELASQFEVELDSHIRIVQ